MARLNTFKVDSKAIMAGQWVKPGDEYDDLEILCRGYTDSYTDYRATKMRRAAVPFNGDQARIPVATARAILVDSLIAHVLMDVRGISDDAGPIDFPRFCELLRDPDYAPLVSASLSAAAMVGQMRVDAVADASGNSEQPSA